MDDLYRTRESAFILERSESEADFIEQMRAHPPTVIGEVTFSQSAVRGEIIAIGFLPRDLFGRNARRKLIEALDLARIRGAKIVGLGGLTSSATRGGRSLLPHADGITLTNGNAYTAATVVGQVKEAAVLFGLGDQAKVGVLGCTGSVGTAASRLLAREGFRLILVGRSRERVSNLLGDLPDATASDDPALFREAEIIVLLVGGESAQISAQNISDGSVVLNFAQPPNITPDLRAGLTERGVTVAEGGLVTIPGYETAYDWGLSDPDSVFACLAETYLFSREGLTDHSVGDPSPEFVQKMERIARRHGVTHRPIAEAPISRSLP